MKTLIRLLLQKQSDLGLHCLSMPFWQATGVQNFRKFTIVRFRNFNMYNTLIDFVESDHLSPDLQVQAYLTLFGWYSIKVSSQFSCLKLSCYQSG